VEILGADLIDDMVLRGHPRTLAKDEVVFHEGDTGDHVFLVRTGQLKVRISAPSGREFLLAIKSAGELIGELAAIDGRARSATAQAMVPSELVVLSAADFLASLERDPKLALVLLRQLSEQIRTASLRTAARASANTRTRLAQRLLGIADIQAEYAKSNAPMQLRLTQDDLAGWIGATREATARALAELRTSGFIRTGRLRVDIVNRQALETVAKGIQ